MKKFFIVCSEFIQPKIYKTLKTAQKYEKQYQDSKVKEFTSLKEAEQFLKELTKRNKQDFLYRDHFVKSVATTKSPIIKKVDDIFNKTNTPSKSIVPKSTDFVITENGVQKYQESQEQDKKKSQEFDSQAEDSPESTDKFKKWIYQYYKHNESLLEKARKKIIINDTYFLFFDGASKSTQGGPSGIGYLIYNKAKDILFENSLHTGYKTNNQSEYLALIFGMHSSLQLGIQNIECFGDSELIVKQINSLYKVKKARLVPYYNLAINLKESFKQFRIRHISREFNTNSHNLAQKSMYSFQKKPQN